MRLLRLVAVLNVLNRTGGMAVRGRITLYTCCSVTLLMYIGALAELDVERGVPGASITDFGEAIWWSFVTVTTVGYGDLSPVTWQGRCIAIGLMITGVALIGIVTATLVHGSSTVFVTRPTSVRMRRNRKRNSCATMCGN